MCMCCFVYLYCISGYIEPLFDEQIISGLWQSIYAGSSPCIGLALRILELIMEMCSGQSGIIKLLHK